MSERGWIKLHRRIREHPLWPVDRRYTTLEAWIDLLLAANHKPTVVNIDFTNIEVTRGQILSSQVKLAKRWGWHRTTVKNLMDHLKSQKMADIETSNKTSSGYTLLTILNYDKYQGVEIDETDSQADSDTDVETDSQPTAKRQPTRHKQEVKNEKNIYPAIFDQVWEIYPERAGSNPKNKAHKAWNARIRDGVEPDEMIAGLHRYIAFVRTTGKVGTETVMQGARFFGPGEEWKNSWAIPAERPHYSNGGFVG